MLRLSIQKPQSGWMYFTRPCPSIFSARSIARAICSADLDLGALDVDDAEAEADLRASSLNTASSSGGRCAVSMTMWSTLQRVEIVDQLRPGAFLDRLAAVVAEAQVHRGLGFFGTASSTLLMAAAAHCHSSGMAGQIRLVDLHDVGVEVLHLLGEHVGDRVRQLFGVAVVPVVQLFASMCGPVSVNLNGFVGERLGARAGDAAGSSVPAPIGPSTTPGGRVRKRMPRLCE